MRHTVQSLRSRSWRTARQAGFTLVELLVVIAIIGTLVGLLLPAVQQARESARNNTCKNNLRNLLFAATQFDSSRGELPGYVNALENTTSNRGGMGGFEQGRRASWIVMLFPHLEQGPLWDEWSRDLPGVDTVNYPLGTPPPIWSELTSGNAPELEILQCPSDPPDGEGLPFLNYVINAGQAFDDASRPRAASGSGPNAIRAIDNNVEYAGNGVAFDRANNVDMLTANGIAGAADGREGNAEVITSIDFISANDGTSRTLMISENLHTRFWIYEGGAGATLADVLDASTLDDEKHLFGFVWHNQVPSSAPPQDVDANNPNIRRVNGAVSSLSPESMVELRNRRSLGYPSSAHPGGVNGGFADGHTVFLSENIEPRIYAQLMTSSRKGSRYFENGVPDRTLPQPADNEF